MRYKYLILIVLVFMLSGCGYESKDIQNVNPNYNPYRYVCINDITYLTYSVIYQFGLTTLLDVDGKPVMCEGK